MKQLRILIKYIQHFLTARNTGGHGVHSPFVYNFISAVVREKSPYYVFEAIEALRMTLKTDKTLVDIEDYGTGLNRRMRITDVVNQSVGSRRKGQLLYRMVNYLKPANVLELGTCLGISTAYLAASNGSINCVTMEGAVSLAKMAEENMRKLNLNNVTVLTNNIDSELISVLERMRSVDFVFVDANHRSEAVLNYFELCLKYSSDDTVFVFDDIYWSADMEFAWEEIKKHTAVTTTIDLFHLGVVFLDKNLGKNHFKMLVGK